MKSIQFFLKDERSDKQYDIYIEPNGDLYDVKFAFGRRGNVGKLATKNNKPLSLMNAELLYHKMCGERLSKGYVAGGIGARIVNDKQPTHNIPQLPNPITEDQSEFYINNPDWMAQEKLDGKHIMADVKNKSVVTSNRNGVTCGIPNEITKELSQCDRIVLDGELIGNIYHTFDALETCVDCRNKGALERFNILSEWIANHKFSNVKIVSCAFTPSTKRSLYESLKHKEGVVFKRIDSKYSPGRPNSGGDMLKCKFWHSATVLVTAINDKRSVMVSVSDNGNLISVGNVTVPPNYDMPKVGSLCEVKYLYIVNSLYQPIYLGNRDDKDYPDTYQSLKKK